MQLYQILRKYSGHPITHQILKSILKDYKRPNDKIYELVKIGVLESVIKGLYVTGKIIGEERVEPFLLANHISGPSYVSSDSALSYYGLIPEKVYGVVSMTTKASKNYSTPLGLFSYTKLKLPYYSFGINSIKLNHAQFALVATPEKALLDKVVTTKGLLLRSKYSAMTYLLEDLRLDENDLKNLDIKSMLSWTENSPKKDSLQYVLNAIKKL